MRFPFATIFLVKFAIAEDGSKGWLRYSPVPDLRNLALVPLSIVVLNSTTSSPVYNAGQELRKGIEGIFGKQLNVSAIASSNSSAIVVGTVCTYTTAYGSFKQTEELDEDGYFPSTKHNDVVIVGHNERGALYGAFKYLPRIAQNNFTKDAFVSNPQVHIRWTNEWDNMDGSIECGYGGPSLFSRTVMSSTMLLGSTMLLSTILVYLLERQDISSK